MVTEAAMQQDVLQDAVGTHAGEGEILTFTLGHEEYGIDILKVQEIRGYEVATHIANAPEYIKGVVNLRGIIVPIIDMRVKFSLPATYIETTVVIILNLGTRVIGIVVDGVSDVIQLKPDQIKPAPEFGSSLDTRYIQGVGAVDERMIILVDIERFFSSDELQMIQSVH